MKTHILSIGTCLVFAAGSLMAAAPETNASPAATAVATPADAPVEGAKPSWNSFTLITRNNIFDPQRVPYTGVPRQAQAPVRLVQEFHLAGTLLKVDKGYDAMFEGDGVPTGVQDVGDVINGFRIKNITINSADLVKTSGSGNDVINVPVTHGLRRINGGEWTASVAVLTYPNRPPRMQPTQPYAYQAPPTYDTYTAPDYSVNTYDNTQNDFTGNTRGRGRRGNNGGGGRNRGGGGGGFNNGGGFGQDDTTAAPAAPADPNILKILQARREAEENAK